VLGGGGEEVLVRVVFDGLEVRFRVAPGRFREVVGGVHNGAKRFLLLQLPWHLALGVGGVLLVQRSVVSNPGR